MSRRLRKAYHVKFDETMSGWTLLGLTVGNSDPLNIYSVGNIPWSEHFDKGTTEWALLGPTVGAREPEGIENDETQPIGILASALTPAQRCCLTVSLPYLSLSLKCTLSIIQSC